MNMYNGFEEQTGLLLIKSMKSQEGLNVIAMYDSRKAADANIIVKVALIDDTYIYSVDREEIKLMLEALGSGKYQVLVVEKIHDITNNAEDLKKIMNLISHMGVAIFELSSMTYLSINDNEEC